MAAPSCVKTHSWQFSLSTARVWPGLSPSLRRPRPNQRDCCAYSAQVTGCQTPNCFCRRATVSGLSRAQWSSCCGSGRSLRSTSLMAGSPGGGSGKPALAALVVLHVAEADVALAAVAGAEVEALHVG